jgi:hypothetical protein
LKRRLYLGALALHLSFVVAVSSHDVLSDLARGLTWLPASLEKYGEKGERITATAIRGFAPNSRLLEGVITFYLYGAGIEGGYGFFAPNVPNSSKIVFELHYGDGRIEYELLHVNDPAAGLRLISVLDYIGSTDYEPLRQVMVKMLAYSVWQKHPDAITIRAIYGTINEPTLAEARKGQNESYHFLYAYDFDFKSQPALPAAP